MTSGSDETSRLLDDLLRAARRHPVPLPAPLYENTAALHPQDFWYVQTAALAVGRLLRLGASAEDLQALARYPFMQGIGAATEIVDAAFDGPAVAGELWFGINATGQADIGK